ncbi:hypothetical protein JTE90_000667 [Oedothorax gibbosus]|uniref:Peptidase M12B domain-containing protein n=1 Tax=Oedothorax gibbosus TaxID=931172 RepID=A0AAV6VXY0_9ARAC|nr:hypothetical protein JTE90_000667 [Oedothorax gibbosus]
MEYFSKGVIECDEDNVQRYFCQIVIKTYEIVDCHSFLPAKYNFNKFPEEDRLQYEADAEVSFRAFNRDFHLLLYEDSNFQDLEVSHTSIKRNLTKTNFYEGIVKEHSLDSAVVGYLNDNVFSGSIKEKEVIYFIEPASSFLSAPIDSSKIVVYRSKDVINKHQDHFEANSSESSLNLFPLFKSFRNMSYLPQGIKKESNDTDYTCQIEMVADHTLYEYFKKDSDTLSVFLYLHAKYADVIFRRTDFDGDGFPDNIRIKVKKISIYKTASDPNYPMAKAQDLDSFLNSFSLRSQNYCISFCLSHRSYKATAVGKAFRPESQPFATPGGICQFSIWKRGVKRYLNTGVVTIVNSRKQAMPLITTMLAFTHEMGHLFGSDHDPVNHLICSPGGNLGNYLMYPRTSTVFKPRNSHFSPCSRQQIHWIIQERGECLKSHPGICGNGVRESDEECDCGWEKSCSHLDSCCTPSDAKPPEKGCTFRKNCSPKESKSRTRDCTVDPANGTGATRARQSVLLVCVMACMRLVPNLSIRLIGIRARGP